MRKALLLYNPLSGRRQGRRVHEVESAQSVLRAGGVEAASAATAGPSDAAGQVRQAIDGGCDAVFACGGDGTVHDVVQGLVGSSTALGVIPLGTANSLAHDLGLPLSPTGAARAALTARPRRIAVGRVAYRGLNDAEDTRYFTVTAGIGVDAHLFYKLNPMAKRRLGMAAYYAKATRLWLTHKMEKFAIELDGEAPRSAEVTQLLAVRIRHFGGVLRELAPGASLDREDLRLVLFHTRSRAAYLGYVMRGLLGAKWDVPGIELMYGTRVSCHPLEKSSRIFVEADGEVLGRLPAEISVVPDALTILSRAG
ncbi:MAG TPA: YegS/Rv2252/BmrU family lipid kinase [Terriglobales bacterium]|jgi:YegS/Rv2252/BmrU family lipid kinase|nr:YegS/Rv2252/BmrU family lipid kinase [Terriglobales bacterium]